MRITRCLSRFVALALVGALATACMQVRSNVSAYSAMTEADNTKRIFIHPYDEVDRQLEWDRYASYLRAKLVSHGFEVTDDIGQADMIAFMGYAIDDGEDVTTTYSVPQWGVTGYSGSTTTGTISSYGGGYGTYSGTTTYTPTYGVTGYSTQTSTRRNYTRSLAIDIYDVQTEKPKWEMRLSSVGECANFQGVAPQLFEAAFMHFPNEVNDEINVDSDGC